VRPFGVSLLLAGYDDNGPQLYQIDPSGSYFAWQVGAVLQLVFGLCCDAALAVLARGSWHIFVQLSVLWRCRHCMYVALALRLAAAAISIWWTAMHCPRLHQIDPSGFYFAWQVGAALQYL
jgi:hypothetical protein